MALVNHLIIFSYDAFSELDFEKAKEYPNFKRLLDNGLYSKQLKSIYPTMTYVIHTTMVTGQYPDKHGIINNYLFEPFVPKHQKEWHWYREAIQADTFYDAAKRKGLKTASIMWPVSGGADIHYNFPEILAINGENQALKILKNGSKLFCLEMALKYARNLKGASQPGLDEFTTNVTLDTFKHKKPNLLMTHLIELDDTKHEFGIDNEMALETVYKRMDVRIGRILDLIEEMGLQDETAILLLGDHGQFTIKQETHLNQLLENHGWIKKVGDGYIWKAYFQSTGGAAYLRIQEGESQETVDAIYEILKDKMNDPDYGIEAIYLRNELDKLRIHPSIALMVEAKEGTAFSELLIGMDHESLQCRGEVRGDHGYSPDKPRYRTGFVLSGVAIPKLGEIGAIHMTDIAPTVADLLGFEFLSAEGESILKQIDRNSEEKA